MLSSECYWSVVLLQEVWWADYSETQDSYTLLDSGAVLVRVKTVARDKRVEPENSPPAAMAVLLALQLHNPLPTCSCNVCSCHLCVHVAKELSLHVWEFPLLIEQEI